MNVKCLAGIRDGQSSHIYQFITVNTINYYLLQFVIACTNNEKKKKKISIKLSVQ